MVFWLKAKGDDYVLKHRSVTEIALEKNALALIVSGGLDDVLPLLRSEERDLLIAYAADVQGNLATLAARIDEIVAAGAHLDQNTFAVEHVQGAPEFVRVLAFWWCAGAFQLPKRSGNS